MFVHLCGHFRSNSSPLDLIIHTHSLPTEDYFSSEIIDNNQQTLKIYRQHSLTYHQPVGEAFAKSEINRERTDSLPDKQRSDSFYRGKTAKSHNSNEDTC